MEIKFNIKNPDSTYLLVKRRSKVDYYFRGQFRRATPHVNRALYFSSLEEAQTACSSANIGKHRPFFKVKKASTYFGSQWRMSFYPYGNNNVEIYNVLVPLNEVFSSKARVVDALQKQKEDTLYRMQQTIGDKLKRLEETKQSVILQQQEIEDSKALVDKLTAFDYSAFTESNRTESEKTAELLYGKN